MTSPYMGLEIPVIFVDPDPLWSEKLNADLTIIDSHNHSTVGVPIRAAAIQLDTDLTFAGFNAIDLRSVILQNLNFDPSDPSDLTNVYVKDGNLYYNNDAGAHVQLTSGTGLNISVGAANAYDLAPIINGNFTILNTNPNIYFKVDTSGGALTVFLPDSSTVVAGRFYIFKDMLGTSETNSISFSPTGGDLIDTVNANYEVKKTFGSWMLVTDADGKWYVSNYSNKQLNDGQIIDNGNGIVVNGNSNGILVTAGGASITFLGGSNEIDIATSVLGITAGVGITGDVDIAGLLDVVGDTTVTGGFEVTGGTLISLDSTNLAINSAQLVLDTYFRLNVPPVVNNDNHYEVNSRTFIRVCQQQPLPRVAAEWELASSLFEKTTVDTLAFLYIPLDLPDGAIITGCIVSVQGGPGHTGTLPQNVPEITFATITYDGGSATIGPGASDGSINGTAYEIQHNIVYTESFTVDKSTYKYYILLASEHGTNAFAGLVVYGAKIQYNITYIDEG